MLDYDYFLAINNGIGFSTLSEIDIAESRRRLREQLATSNHFDPAATRNGVTQGLVVTPSESYYKYEVEALPGDELYPGDIIYTAGEHWIVNRTRVASPYQTIGLMWLCNHLFKWQNGTSEVIERWGVLDPGVYSSTRDGDKTAMTADKQYKVYLPYDEDTAKLFIDKRLAVGVMYDRTLKQVLNVQRITGFDPVAWSYGNGAHLLVLNVRSDDFVSPTDSIEQMVCDYIAPDDTPPDVFDGHITGPSVIRLGGMQRGYTADYDVAEWSVTNLRGVNYTVDGNTLTLSVEDIEELLGEEIAVTGITSGGEYARCFVEVKR